MYFFIVDKAKHWVLETYQLRCKYRSQIIIILKYTLLVPGTSFILTILSHEGDDGIMKLSDDQSVVNLHSSLSHVSVPLWPSDTL